MEERVYLVEERALFRRNLREGARKTHEAAAQNETRSRVVLDAEHVFGILRREVEGGIARNLVENELLKSGAVPFEREGELRAVERRERFVGGVFRLEGVARRLEPRVEPVHELEPGLEVLRILDETPASLEETACVRLGVERGGLCLRVSASGRLLVERRDAREFRQLGIHVARRLRPRDAFAAGELVAYERFDRGLDGGDPARRQRLADPVVLQKQGVFDARGNVRLAAEQIDNGLPEKVARDVVRALVGLAAGEGERAIRRRRDDCTPSERRAARLGAGDGLFVAAVQLDLGEIRKGLERFVVFSDVDGHGCLRFES